MRAKIIIAKKSGLCFGVRRAIKLAKDKAKQKHEKVFTLGPIIHNPQTVELLKTKNVFPLENITSGVKPGSSIIIRSHGIPKEIFEALERQNFEVTDATCPFVQKAQNIVKSLTEKRLPVLVIGDKNHPEIIGLMSHANKDTKIINSLEELKNLEFPEEINIVCQTTHPIEKLNSVVNALTARNIKTNVFNTICNATIERQEEAKKIADQADLVLVIGGRNSSNTKKLFEICKDVNENTIFIEDENELDVKKLKTVEKIGIVTGASTPSWIIRKVMNKIRNS